MKGLKNNRRFIIKADLTTPGEGKVVIELQPLDDLTRFQASAATFEAQQWNIPQATGIQLLRAIRADQQVLMDYYQLGSRSFFSFFRPGLAKQYHSCGSWCKQKLADIGIVTPDRWYHSVAMPPSAVTSPDGASGSAPGR